MAVEIERKFLVNKEKWNNLEKGIGSFYRQGYISTDPEKTIRVRLTEEAGFLTIKGRSIGFSRPEFEYVIPKDEAKELLDRFAVSEIIKKRYKITFKGKVWEVDEFLGDNLGLLLAEIELTDETEKFLAPEWVAKEVTLDERYYNSKLSVNPFKNWG